MRSMLRALALGVALSTPVVSSATTLLPLDVEGLVDRSERVVLARVEDLRVEAECRLQFEPFDVMMHVVGVTEGHE